MENQLKIIPTDLLEVYLESFPVKVKEAFEQLHDAEISTDTFSFYTSVASVFSSKIEGEEIELDSYIKYKRFGLEFLPDYTKKIDDLYNAYTYAKSHDMNQEHIQVVHQLLSKHILSEAYHGRVRTQNMYVTTSDGRIEYVAASPFIVNRELELFYEDLDNLLKQDLSFEEVFYFASMVHLVFVKIHPWNDGNGRSARLLEKWFLAHFLGEKSWFIQSEKYYYQHHNTYYQNIRLLGLEYTELDYAKALPFLQMLPNSLFTP
ncbi:Fic family protein [Flectobacillus roseus]|uniref:Fic family protein n=1 Tax=Flectobacillus roseus TaxID=502259 RepID=A0ABT6Y7P6_9BACT|nr:Fic family protein [Flectobacillus roseus]MDI9859271.1 Fic family protein [Flectobacillus roseus]